MDIKKKLYNAYDDKIKENKKPYKTLATNLALKRGFMVNAVKLKKTKAGWKMDEIGVVKLPKILENLFLSDLGEYGVKKVCDPNMGKIYILEANGVDGFGREYKTAKAWDGKPMLLKKV